MHENYCFAGQPAPCPGYFADDILPCVCSSEEKLLFALSQVAIPAVPVQDSTPAVHILPLSA
jgi:hypothetical protein